MRGLERQWYEYSAHGDRVNAGDQSDEREASDNRSISMTRTRRAAYLPDFVLVFTAVFLVGVFLAPAFLAEAFLGRRRVNAC